MRHAFTVIELLLAIALGGLLVFTAFGAFRIAQAAITTGQRMASENSVLRTGYFYAMHDVDFWIDTRRHVENPKIFDSANPLSGDQLAFSSLPPNLINDIDNRPTEDWWHWVDRNPKATPVTTPPTPPIPHPNPYEWHTVNFTFTMAGVIDPIAIYNECHGFYFNKKSREKVGAAIGWYPYLMYIPPHALTHEAGSFINNNFAYPGDWVCTTQKGTFGGGGAYLTSAKKLYPEETAFQNIIEKRWSRELLDVSLRPIHWPNLNISIKRGVDIGVPRNIVEINGKSPVTGSLLNLRFDSHGTSIRGARISHGIENLVNY